MKHRIFKLESKVLHTSRSQLFHGLILFIIYIVNETVSWPLLRLWNVYGSSSDFIDLRWFWISARCYNEVGIGIYESKGSFCGGYQYGIFPIKMILKLGISESWVQIIGYSFMMFFCFLMAKYLLPLCSYVLYKKSLFYVVSCSPPFMLMVQRGQIDLFVTAMAFISIKLSLLQRKSWIFAIISVGLLSLVTVIKIYPILFLFLIGLLSGKRSFLLTHWIAILLLLPTLIQDLSFIPLKINSAPGGTYMSFGFLNMATRLSETQTFELSKSLIMVMSFIVHGIILILLFNFSGRFVNSLSNLKDLNVNNHSYYIWMSIFLSCYFLGNNIDFRLIFMLLAVVHLCRAAKGSKDARPILFLALSNLFLSFQSGGMEFFGDLTVAILAMFLLNCLIWALPKLAVELKGILLRPLRHES